MCDQTYAGSYVLWLFWHLYGWYNFFLFS